MGHEDPIEHRSIHLDWSDDPPRHRRGPLLARDPAGQDSAKAEVELRIRAALQPLQAAGWEPDGELWEAASVEARERRYPAAYPRRGRVHLGGVRQRRGASASSDDP